MENQNKQTVQFHSSGLGGWFQAIEPWQSRSVLVTTDNELDSLASEPLHSFILRDVWLVSLSHFIPFSRAASPNPLCGTAERAPHGAQMHYGHRDNTRTMHQISGVCALSLNSGEFYLEWGHSPNIQFTWKEFTSVGTIIIHTHLSIHRYTHMKL